MTKMLRAFVLAGAALAVLGATGQAAACPPCGSPALWDKVCRPQYCAICGCNDRAAAPVELQTPADPSTCATPEDVLAPVSVPDAAPSAAPSAD